MLVMVIWCLVGARLAGWAVVAGWRRDVTTREATITTASRVAATAAASNAATDAASNATSDAASDAASDATSDATSNATTTTAILLGLVLDEVDLWLGWLRGCGCWDDNILLILGLLDQHIDESLLLILRLQWDDRCLVRGWRWRLDEDDLVVLLRLSNWQIWTLTDLLLLWWWHMHIDVLLHQRGTTAAASEATARTLN